MSQPSTRKPAVPQEIRGWNWGAFWLNWIWGIANKTYIALLALIPGVNIIMMFVLGFKGNEWAWKNRDWSNKEEFKDTQQIWAIWGWGLLIIFILLILIAGLTAAYLILRGVF
ncbi:hypothetical protein [Dethiobacter alkaliphilus]|uniref:Uncharacterized protein n=1 Tax=Dethiobacter alkaliphilus AHT 1 TaxID=555088 RepID=C0GGK5_DETAL|nr:hypothetical protein [Dethiobacter alkaliphilus]EEG77446.1 hypothetical protein DealDRAFT_1569 [Dethiobacter alkaliphilus AHT 1]